VGLGDLADRLDATERWDQTLSSGGRQRLAFARLLLQKPELIVLDEATSALDEAGQMRLMSLLRQTLPRAAILSIDHRAALEQHHDRCFLMVRGAQGPTLVPAQPTGRHLLPRSAPIALVADGRP
jgi:putative ATP-binding cassette transporter